MHMNSSSWDCKGFSMQASTKTIPGGMSAQSLRDNGVEFSFLQDLKSHVELTILKMYSI